MNSAASCSWRDTSFCIMSNCSSRFSQPATLDPKDAIPSLYMIIACRTNIKVARSLPTRNRTRTSTAVPSTGWPVGVARNAWSDQDEKRTRDIRKAPTDGISHQAYAVSNLCEA